MNTQEENTTPAILRIHPDLIGPCTVLTILASDTGGEYCTPTHPKARSEDYVPEVAFWRIVHPRSGNRLAICVVDLDDIRGPGVFGVAIGNFSPDGHLLKDDHLVCDTPQKLAETLAFIAEQVSTMYANAEMGGGQ